MNPLHGFLVRKGFRQIGSNVFIVSDDMIISAAKKIQEENRSGRT